MKSTSYTEAIQLLQKALLLGKKMNDGDKQLFSYNLIALCFYHLRNYQVSLDYIDRTLELLLENENYLIRIQILNTKGGVYLKNKEFELAITAFKECL